MVQKRILFFIEILWGLPCFPFSFKSLKGRSTKPKWAQQLIRKHHTLTLYLNPTSPMPIANSITHSQKHVHISECSTLNNNNTQHLCKCYHVFSHTLLSLTLDSTARVKHIMLLQKGKEKLGTMTCYAQDQKPKKWHELLFLSPKLNFISSKTLSQESTAVWSGTFKYYCSRQACASFHFSNSANTLFLGQLTRKRKQCHTRKSEIITAAIKLGFHLQH